MIVEIGLVAAVGVAAYEYVTNAKFKAAVSTQVTAAQTEVAAIRTKAASTVPVVDADFAKAEAALITLAKKL